MSLAGLFAGSGLALARELGAAAADKESAAGAYLDELPGPAYPHAGAMTTTGNVLFEQLRALVLVTLPSDGSTFTREDLVPIEGAVDGEWICLSRGGEVGLLDAAGRFDPARTFAVSKTALIGSLAQRFPLASWFIPKAANPQVCPSCQGRGAIADLPIALSQVIRCQCGGLGWLAPS